MVQNNGETATEFTLIEDRKGVLRFASSRIRSRVLQFSIKWGH